MERAIDPFGASGQQWDAWQAMFGPPDATGSMPRRLADLGLRPERIDWLAAHSGGASMRGNPTDLAPAALVATLEAVY